MFSVSMICTASFAVSRCRRSLAKQHFTNSTAPSGHSSGTLQTTTVDLHLDLTDSMP